MNTQELLNKIKDLCILCVGTKEYIELENGGFSGGNLKLSQQRSLKLYLFFT